MRVSVIGNGRWGGFLAWYLGSQGHSVMLYGRAESPRTARFLKTRGNGLVSLPPSVTLTSDLQAAVAGEVILISVPSQSLRGLVTRLAGAGANGKLLVLCMKGLEGETGKRLSAVAAEACAEAGVQNRMAVWLGPGHVQEFVRGVPNCMVIDAQCGDDKLMLVHAFSGGLIRFYYGEDMIGNEVGAAAKNVVGIAAGMLDGYGLSTLKGALMSRGTREFARLIVALGGSELSAYGLCHLGDYEATLFSPHSHNRRFGELFASGKDYSELAEGYYTAKALMALQRQTGAELPISTAVYRTLYEGLSPRQAVDMLFSRSLKQEF